MPPKPATPEADDAEFALIGAILLEPTKVLELCASKKLTPDCFARLECRAIFKGMDKMNRDNKAIDTITVSRELSYDSMILSQWMELCPVWTHAEYFVDLLVSAKAKQRLNDLALEMQAASKNGKPAPDIYNNFITRAQAECCRFKSRHAPSTITAAGSFVASDIPEPPQIVQGLVHQGSKMVFGGPSKAFKSWTLLDMCLAVSTGKPWLDFETTQGLVLYINFELQPYFIKSRLKSLASARDCEIDDKYLRVWNRRGLKNSLPELLPDLLRQIRDDKYLLIVVDPIYKALLGRNENDAGDIGQLCNELEAVAFETGAAVAIGAHFAKGTSSMKEAIDRISGSGVWGRDPDTIMVATPHAEDEAFSVDMILRNLPPQDPFSIKWNFPHFSRADELDPADLKQPRTGRERSVDVAEIMEHFEDGITTKKWRQKCADEGNVSKSTFHRRMTEAKDTGLIVRNGSAWKTGEK